MATTMAKKQGGKGGAGAAPKRSDGGKHKAPRVHVPLPKELVDAFRAWCEEERRVLGWEIAHLMEEALRAKGRWPAPAAKEGGEA